MMPGGRELSNAARFVVDGWAIDRKEGRRIMYMA